MTGKIRNIFISKMNSTNVMENLVDKVAFSNYLPLMTRATADDIEPTPGYILEEIEKITFINAINCNRLVVYLLQRLGRQSNNVKLKVLKIMNHLVKKGHSNFRIILRRNDGHIKLSTVNRVTSNPKNKTEEAVVQAAQNLLQVLFDPELLRKDEEGLPEGPQVKPHLGALGCQGVSQGKYEGFGNSPVEKESLTGKVMDYFEKLLNPSEDLNSDMKSILYSSPGNYRPPVFDVEDDCEVKPQQTLANDLKKEVKAHVPGKAGGGWETDEEEEHRHCNAKAVLQTLNSSVITSSSESIERLDMLTAKENTAEAKFVENFCEINSFPVSTSELDRAMKQCSKMDGIRILQSINHFLIFHCQSIVKENTVDEETMEASVNSISKSKPLLLGLLLLEWFLYVGKVAPEISSVIVKPAILTLLESTTSLIDIHAKTLKLKLMIDKGK